MVDALDQRHRLRSRIRAASRGFDPVMTGIGIGTASSDLLQAGLRVPYAPTAANGELRDLVVSPYLFQLCTVGIGGGLWVTGMGLLSVIGDEQGHGGTPRTPPIFPNVIQQQSASFRFSDCKPIRWGLRRLRKPTIPWSGRNPLNTSSFAWRYSDNPALLYEDAAFTAANTDRNGTPDNYLMLQTYMPPAAPYVFPGSPVGGNLGCFDSLDFPWQIAQRKSFEPIWVDGAGYLSLMAWVEQTNPASRSTLRVPDTVSLPPTGMPENAFLADWGTDTSSNTGGAIQYSVGGWLEVEWGDNRRVLTTAVEG